MIPSAEKKPGTPNWVSFITLALTLFTFYHLYRARSPDLILKYVMTISIPILAFYLGYLIKSWKAKVLKKEDWYYYILLPLLIILLSISYYALAVTIKDLYKWILSPVFSNNTKTILIVSFTLIIGGLLFKIRSKMRCFYGLSEIIAGLIIAVNKLSETDSYSLGTGFYLTYLTASIYLVVRGLDNIDQGLSKPPLDEYAIRILKFLKQRN